MIKETIPVLPSSNIERDVNFYTEKIGFEYQFGDQMYAGLKKGDTWIHLQWHADTEDDPLLGGSVVKFFVEDINVVFQELVDRGAVTEDKLVRNTDWGTHEIGFYDPNNNAIFFVQLASLSEGMSQS